MWTVPSAANTPRGWSGSTPTGCFEREFCDRGGSDQAFLNEPGVYEIQEPVGGVKRRRYVRVIASSNPLELELIAIPIDFAEARSQVAVVADVPAYRLLGNFVSAQNTGLFWESVETLKPPKEEPLDFNTISLDGKRLVIDAEGGFKVEKEKPLHTCHATGCETAVPPEMFMCKAHWFSLPKAMRDKIWGTYRPGQCDDWKITHEYAEAARAAVRLVAEREGVEPDVKVYDMLDPGREKPEESVPITYPRGKLNPESPLTKMLDVVDRPKTAFQQHLERWKDCTACALHQCRRRMVFCRGKIPCDILFVGEAPGESEDALGSPFKGPAGHLLDGIIKEALTGGGWDGRFRLAFTNLVCCIPKADGGKMEPPKECIKACEPRLVEFVRVARPKLIVMVGALARKHVGGQAQFCKPGENDQPPWITEGRFLEFADIVHPSAILQAKAGMQGMMQRRAVITLANAIEEKLCR